MQEKDKEHFYGELQIVVIQFSDNTMFKFVTDLWHKSLELCVDTKVHCTRYFQVH